MPAIAKARKEAVEPAKLDTQLQGMFRQALAEIDASLIERTAEVRMVMTGLIAGANPLLVGPPGTGKSLLSDSVCNLVNGRLFSALITKYTVPEELFGPFSLVKLQQDDFERVTKRRLPEADIAFLDEIFKGSSAILNTLLKILNEGIFENNGLLVKVPTMMVVSASNEWPNDQEGGKELAALFDRFLLRRTVRPITSQRGLERLLWERDHTPKLTVSITPQQVMQARGEAKSIPWTDKAKNDLYRILDKIKNEGIIIGDRRQFKSIDIVQAYSYMEGASVVESQHLEILQDVLWTDPNEQPGKVAEIVMRIANPQGMQLAQYVQEAEQISATTAENDLNALHAGNRKLTEIQAKLEQLKPNERVQAALAYVAELRRNFALKAIGNIT